MDDPSFGQEWGPLIAAFFAFLAGVAAWVSALTARRSLRDGLRPNMATQLVAPAGQPLQLHVRNFGAGPAKNVGF
jgi:hypothetical protein